MHILTDDPLEIVNKLLMLPEVINYDDHRGAVHALLVSDIMYDDCTQYHMRSPQHKLEFFSEIRGLSRTVADRTISNASSSYMTARDAVMIAYGKLRVHLP